MGWWSSLKRGVKKIGRGIKKIVKKVVKGIGDIFVGAAKFVGSLFGWNMAPDPGINSVEQQFGTTVTKQGGDHHIPLVFAGNGKSGQAKVGGIMTHMSSDGTDNKYLYVTYVLCHGGVNTISVYDKEFKSNDWLTWFRWQSYGTVASGPTNYGSGNDYYTTDNALHGGNNYDESSIYYVEKTNKHYGKIFAHNGAYEPQTSGSSVNPAYSPDWHKDKQEYRGMAFIKMRLEWPSDLDANENRVPFTGLPSFEFMVGKGANHMIFVGTNATNYYQSNTNSVNVLYDLLRSKAYGLGIDKIYIDSNSFSKLAQQDYLAGHNISGSSGQYFGVMTGFFRAWYRFDTSQPAVANIKSLLYAMGCTLIWKENKFFIKPNPNCGDSGYDSSNPTIWNDMNINEHTVLEADCIGGVSYETPSEDQKYETVELDYTAQDMTANQIGDRQRILKFSLLAPYLKSRIDLNATARLNETIVGPGNLRLAETKLLESHYGSTISLTLGAKHSNIEVYDIINVTYPRANLGGARYVVLDVEHTTLETVNIRAIRYLYDDDAEGISARDIIAKYLIAEPKQWLAVPTGFGLDNNTQVDQFLPAPRQASQLTLLRCITSRDFFGKRVAGNGQSFFVNRVKLEWEIAGDPNNTRFTVQLKKQGEQIFDTLFDTNETYAYIENLEDNTSYFVRVVPKNQAGFGVGRTNKFTTLDSTTLQTVPINYTFGVTDDNGNGQSLKVAGSSAEFDTYVSSGNPYASSYTAGTYQPFGLGETSVAGTTVTDTYKDVLQKTSPNSASSAVPGASTCWNDLDWNQNGGSGSRSDGGTVNTFNPSDLRPGAYADEAAWNAAVGTWGGTKHVANQYGELQWLSYSKTMLLATTSASNRGTTLTGKTVDTGSTLDWYWEGRVELGPDSLLPLDQDSYAFGSSGSVLNDVAKSDSMFVYMYSSNTNDAINPPVWATPTAATPVFNSYKPGSAPNTLTDWNTATGDSRLFDATYSAFSIAKAFDSKYGTSPGSNADRKWGQAWPVNEGRYVTPVLVSNQAQSAATFGIRNYDFKLKRDLHRMTFKNIDTSALSGSTAGRVFTWTTARFGRIKDVIINTNTASSNNIIGYLTADPVDNVQSITIKLIETQNNNAVDANVDIIIEGFPEVVHVTEEDHLGNIRAIEYKNNFDGTLSSV